MPPERSNKSKTPNAVPSIGDPDRKRVLNVLAQRRYREKRRAKIAELEAKLKATAQQLTPPPSDKDDISFTPECVSIGQPDILRPSNEDNAVEEVTRDPNPTTHENNYADLEFGFFPEMDFPSLDPAYHLTLSAPAPPNPNTNTYPSPLSFTFPLTPDSSHFPMPVLPALRAFATIASTLNITAHIYNPSYLHILPPTPHPALPQNLSPTPAQTTIPHHPILDTLPWPGAREKLILIFSFPSELRPPVAQDGEEGQGSAIMRMMLDLDDSREGIRNHGCATAWGEGNELVEEAWEIGEAFYERWWWCLDSEVVERSNRRRTERGVGRLRLRSV